MHYKQSVSNKFAESWQTTAFWYSPLREALSAFVDSTQQNVTGTVRMKLYKGNCVSAGNQIALFPLQRGNCDVWGGSCLMIRPDSAGFINLRGLPLKVHALMKQKNPDAK